MVKDDKNGEATLFDKLRLQLADMQRPPVSLSFKGLKRNRNPTFRLSPV